MNQSPFFSIIIPVYNGGPQLARCLASVHRSSFDNWELLVVDDGSTDGSDRVARQAGARVLKTGARQGPAAARNLGARLARGSYLFFTDADCELHADTLARAAQYFIDEPQLDALFGSYDDAPAAANLVAQYKNLFHYYIHQNSRTTAKTFWTGCGVIKRSRFLALGGFDTRRYRQPSIEDIELGYRLEQAGGQIRLAKGVQVKHLKAWTLLNLLKSDILDRGIPWTQLMWRDGAFLDDLNLQTHNRVSVAAVVGLLLALVVAWLQPQAIWVVAGLAGLLVGLNFDLYRFFYQKRGLWFALRVLPLHWLYYLYNAIAFALGSMLTCRDQLKADPLPAAPTPLTDSAEPESGS
jgi:glycosyltransferase involved in cell wall biosynthesis